MNPRRPTRPIPTPVNLSNLSPATDLPSPRCPPINQRSAPYHAAANTHPNADPTQDQKNLLKPLQIRQSHADPVLPKKEPTPTANSSHTTRTSKLRHPMPPTPPRRTTKKRPPSESTAPGSTPPQLIRIPDSLSRQVTQPTQKSTPVPRTHTAAKPTPPLNRCADHRCQGGAHPTDEMMCAALGRMDEQILESKARRTDSRVEW